MLVAPAVAASRPLVPAPQAVAEAATYHETIAGTLVQFEMVRVPGAPAFYLGKTEVTWDMYDVFALGLDESTASSGADAVARPSSPYGAPDYGWGHAGFPVMSVTRQAAEAFCAWLTAKTGRTYRLPTEAEWTHAAMLAARGVGNASADAAATTSSLAATSWFQPNADRRTHAVAARSADALGLFDLFGNVAEWVTTDSGELVTRGGSYRDAVVGPSTRAVQDFSWNDRDPQLPKSRWWLSDGPFVGFRLVSPID